MLMWRIKSLLKYLKRLLVDEKCNPYHMVEDSKVIAQGDSAQSLKGVRSSQMLKNEATTLYEERQAQEELILNL